MAPCDLAPCINGGSCRNIDLNTYHCSCPGNHAHMRLSIILFFAGYTGKTCETFVSPCDLAPCSNGGTCQYIDLTRYHCFCPGIHTCTDGTQSLIN